MSIDKKYQVFVCSTYDDLKEERQVVMQSLLELDCIPVGMELFPAADDDQWTLIKGLINDVDYYVLIVGGRYGSLGPGGKSYTQMEYEYAIKQGIPTISFLHEDRESIPHGKVENTDDGKKNLDDFIQQVQSKMCSMWNSPAELGLKVTQSIVRLIKSKPRIGWVKADRLSSDNVNKELLDLRKSNEILKLKLSESLENILKSTSTFAQGTDPHKVKYHYGKSLAKSIKVYTWDKLFTLIGPLMIDKAHERDLVRRLNEDIHKSKHSKKHPPTNTGLLEGEIYTILMQFVSLKLIETKDCSTFEGRTFSCWTLTDHGFDYLAHLLSIKRDK